MEIPFFHEETFAPAGILESHTSLVYRQCFGEIAKFTINVPLDDNSKQYVGESFLVELERDRGLYGITTRVEKETKNGKSVLSFSGKTTQLYLQDRIVWDTYNGEANLSTMGYDVVDRNAINPVMYGVYAPKRVLKNFRIPTNHEVLGTSRAWQVRGSQLNVALENLLLDEKIGYKVFTNIKEKYHELQIYAGLDKTIGQSVNPPVYFSTSFDNILETKYTRDSGNLKNVALIAGAGEGAARKLRDLNVDKYEGYARKELFVDARDLQEEDDDGDIMPPSRYNAILDKRGEQKLQECQVIETFNGDVSPSGVYEFGKDYDLGDLVTFQDDEISLRVNAEVWAVEKTFKGNDVKIVVEFGFQVPGLDKIIIRKVVSNNG